MDPSYSAVPSRNASEQDSEVNKLRFIISPSTRITRKNRLKNRRRKGKVLTGDEGSFDVDDLDNRYVVRAGESIIPTAPPFESESADRRRHLMEAKGALNIPPVATFICCINIAVYYCHEKLFTIKEEHIYVSWKHVWNDGQVWRLFVAQFFHFSLVNMLVNSATLFTIGRYLERKVTMAAMLLVILVMSAATQMIYIMINPWMCHLPRSEFTYGFGNVVYSLRVLLAYALEPRNYEKDLVFGLYPMVVSASHAPWQPVLDLLIFRIVLPEQCVTGHLSGIIAGFLVSGALLLWPTKGVYIANPPYYWTLMGTPDPNDRHGEGEDGDSEDEEFWKVKTFSNSDFWLPTSKGALSAPSTSDPTRTQTTGLTHSQYGNVSSHQPVTESVGRLPRRRRPHQPWENSMKKRSEELKGKVAEFLSHPTKSVKKLISRILNRNRSEENQGNSNSPQDGNNNIGSRNGSETKITEVLHIRNIDDQSDSEFGELSTDSKESHIVDPEGGNISDKD